MRSAAGAMLLSGAVAAQAQPLWHFEGQVSGGSWRSVAIGASGSQVMSNPNGGSGAVALFAGGEVPSTPLIWADNSSASARTGIVRAAAQTDVYACLYFEVVPTSQNAYFTPKLKRHGSASPTSTWTKTFNPVQANSIVLPAGLHVSESGERILAWWYDTAQTKTYVAGYDSAGTLLFAVSVQTQMAPQASAADSDGRRLALVLPTLTVVLDGSTGAIVKTISGFYNPTSAVALGPNGDSLALGNLSGAIDFYRSNGTATLAFAYSVPAVTSQVPRNASLSIDGGTLVVASQSNVDTHALLIRIFALGATSAAQRHQHALLGTGGYTTMVTDLGVSRDGRIVSACTSGDENDILPSVLVYRRNATGYELFDSRVLPGTAYDLDLSQDGRMLAVASSTMHYSASTYTGVVDAFDLGGDLSVNGIPHAGTSVLVEQKAAPGQTCVLFVSDALLQTPVAYGGMGSLLIQNPLRLGASVADAQGVARFTFNLPSGASAYGHTFYTQGLALVQRKLTANYAPITVVP